jgi:two-component system CheB/CheR fusion protein
MSLSEPGSPPRPSFVVGIGASAGGLEALERFFDHVPETSGMAFVVVQHLSPDFKSLMDELLARHTELPIHLVENGMEMEPDHVYLIPAKKEMIVSGGRLLLGERDRQQELALPIDVFFRSLARDCGPRAIAVVLSGSGSDGSRGVVDVHEAGGLVIVQDVESAQFDGMPRAVRDTGVADHVASPDAMPSILLEHAGNTDHVPAVQRRREPSGAKGFDAVYEMLQGEFGIDFTHYKPSTVTRRIERRLQLSRAQSLEDYVERLDRERTELDILYRDLLIGVTRFFRNEEAFERLETTVLPDLFRKLPDGVPLRAWVAGCATGEEAYSLAIVLHELAAQHGDRPIKIFASDVHRGSIEIATRATYEEEALRNVSPARLERYFIRRGRTYQIVPELRQLIVFAPHNVIRDAPFTRVDLVSCRNLLIYLQPPIQQKVLSLFHFALNRGGVLMLGPSESPGALLPDFEAIDRHWRIYRKYSDARLPIDPRQRLRTTVEPRIATPPQLPFARHSLSQLLGTYDALLDEHMPPGLLVTERGELIHAFAGASRFLKHRDGRQALDVFDLVDNELKMILVGGLKRATKERGGIVFKGVRIETESGIDRYKVTLRQIRGKTTGLSHVLIAFEPSAGVAPAEPTSEREIDLGDVSRYQIAALGAELAHTKENLQAAIEELETSNEELQAANEELLASNEELQSTNEELQSVNEELYTVNAEYQRKIAELVELSNDMDNLLASTDIGMIFLDRQLKVRKFTQQIGNTFNLLQQDVGRSLETFTHNIAHPELMDDLRRVLTSGERVERAIEDRQGGAYFMRILPYRAKGAVEGVVLTLIDVSSLKAAEDALFHERYLLDSLLFGVPDSIYFKDQRGRFIRANRAMAARLGTADPRSIVGKAPSELEDAPDTAGRDADERVLRTGQAQHYELERHARDDGSVEWLLATRLPLRDRKDGVVGVIGILRDVSEQKRAEHEAQEAVRRRDQFLAMLSHELRNPLNAIVASAALLQSPACQGDKRDHVLTILERQARQMARLLDDLLEASRVTQSKIELRKTVSDLVAISRDAADAVRALMDEKGIDLEVAIDKEPLYADVDPVRLQQVQVNLLNNAAKYTPRGGHVRLETRRDEGEAMICVQDTGAGIPREMLGTVFDLFVQARRTLDRSDGGLGLGLSLVRSLVTMHGGTVSAHSEGEGAGSRFVVRLPLAVPPEGERSRRPVRPRQLPRDAEVVVVEDNPDNRDMLCELLRYAGFTCHTADDGPAGLALVREVRPDVVIIDVGLPGMNGFDLARALRKDPTFAETYLIALTGYGQKADRQKAFEAGFDEHLVKPLQPDLLMRLLRGEGMAQA